MKEYPAESGAPELSLAKRLRGLPCKGLGTRLRDDKDFQVVHVGHYKRRPTVRDILHKL